MQIYWTVFKKSKFLSWYVFLAAPCIEWLRLDRTVEWGLNRPNKRPTCRVVFGRGGLGNGGTCPRHCRLLSTENAPKYTTVFQEQKSSSTSLFSTTHTCLRVIIKPRLHRGNMLLVAVNKIIVSLLPVCCRIRRDTSRPWHKWIVIMSRESRYSQHVARTSNLLPGYMLPWCKRGFRV